MPKLSEMLGDDLPPGKVLLEAPVRPPRFPGEVIYDQAANIMWVAVAAVEGGWKAVTTPPVAAPAGANPVIFSWVIDGAALSTSYAFLRIYYARPNANTEQNPWEQIRVFVLGDDVAYRTPINISAQIQAKGAGYYLPVVTAFNASNQERVFVLPLTIAQVNTSLHAEATILRKVVVDSFNVGFGLAASQVQGFEVFRPLAQAVLRFD